MVPLPIEYLHAEVLVEQLLQSVQCQVGQHGGNNPALWRACLCGEEDSIFHEPRFQPFLQYHFVRGNMPEHPFVGDVVKTSANVSFQHPRGAGLATQCQATHLNGIGGGAFGTKAVGI